MSGTIGPDVVDIRKLYAQTGAFTYDPGFTSTASCRSELTYIDGDQGVLLHRGYPIGELAENSSFMEVAYLLLNGELPNQGELSDSPPPSRATPWCMSSWRRSSVASAAMRTHGDHVRRRRRAVGLLSRFDRHPRSGAAHHRVASPDRQDPDDRGDGVQVQRGPALPVPGQLAVLHRQLPAHDLRRSGRAV